ncbi:MAG: hypothetical protein ACU0DI_07730 [Paracoccaceae bacterium]
MTILKFNSFFFLLAMQALLSASRLGNYMRERSGPKELLPMIAWNFMKRALFAAARLTAAAHIAVCESAAVQITGQDHHRDGIGLLRQFARQWRANRQFTVRFECLGGECQHHHI